MINFNVPPYLGTEIEYVSEAIRNHKICGDGEFTKKASAILEEMTGTGKCLLTTSCTLRSWQRFWPIYNPGMK